MLRSVVLALVVASATSAPAQPGRNEAILESARRVALDHARNLPNFVCTEEVRRAGDWSGTADWIPLDKLLLTVAYRD